MQGSVPLGLEKAPRRLSRKLAQPRPATLAKSRAITVAAATAWNAKEGQVDCVVLARFKSWSCWDSS